MPAIISQPVVASGPAINSDRVDGAFVIRSCNISYLLKEFRDPLQGPYFVVEWAFLAMRSTDTAPPIVTDYTDSYPNPKMNLSC